MLKDLFNKPFSFADFVFPKPIIRPHAGCFLKVGHFHARTQCLFNEHNEGNVTWYVFDKTKSTIRNWGLLIFCVRQWPLPAGAFQGQWSNWIELNRLRILLAGDKTVGYIQVQPRRWTRGCLEQTQLVVRAVFELGISRFQVPCPHHLATLPRQIMYLIKCFFSCLTSTLVLAFLSS